MAEKTELQKMLDRIAKMDDETLIQTFESLKGYDPFEYYQPGIKMSVWEHAVYNEVVVIRQLKISDEIEDQVSNHDWRSQKFDETRMGREY